MKLLKIKTTSNWRVVGGTSRSQAAIMVVAPGESEGGAGNRHRKSDQWLLVLARAGTAVVKGRKVALKPRTLLLIEKGEAHQVRNTGKKNLETLNFYSPPAY